MLYLIVRNNINDRQKTNSNDRQIDKSLQIKIADLNELGERETGHGQRHRHGLTISRDIEREYFKH